MVQTNLVIHMSPCLKCDFKFPHAVICRSTWVRSLVHTNLVVHMSPCQTCDYMFPQATICRSTWAGSTVPGGATAGGYSLNMCHQFHVGWRGYHGGDHMGIMLEEYQ